MPCQKQVWLDNTTSMIFVTETSESYVYRQAMQNKIELPQSFYLVFWMDIFVMTS